MGMRVVVVLWWVLLLWYRLVMHIFRALLRYMEKSD
jgi:hypothetical protein